MSHIKPVNTDNAPMAIGPYSQAIISGDLVFCSGQIGIDPAKGELVSGGITEESQRVFENIKAILEEAGSSIKNIVRTEIFLTDMKSFEDVNKIYQEFFHDDPFPARFTVEVSALPKGALIEMSCIATI